MSAFSLVACTSLTAPALADPSPVTAVSSVSTVSALIHQLNPGIPGFLGEQYAAALLDDARRTALDPALLFAIVGVESHFKADSVSRHGAVGLGQLMPVTAAALHVDPTSPWQNLLGTSRYLRSLLDRFSGSSSAGVDQRVIAAYNAGPGAIARNHGAPTSTANASYVTRVLALWQAAHRSLDGTAPSDPLLATLPRTISVVTSSPEQLFWNEPAPGTASKAVVNGTVTRKSGGFIRRILHF